MHEGMRGDLGFRTIYRAANGRAIVEVIHEVSMKFEDRTHPSSYMAFVNLNEALPLFASEIGRMSELRTSGMAHRKLAGLWRGESAYSRYFTTYKMPSTEPAMGFYYDTEWAARIALKACEDPFNLHLAVEQIAREDRNERGRKMVQQLRSKHFDGLAKAIQESRARGKLPVNTVTFVEEIGGGLQALAVHFKLQDSYGYENLYLWLTDFEGIMIGIYDGSDEANEGSAGSMITIEGANGFEDPHTVKGAVATIEALVMFARLHKELF